jgi:hypothetical protein
MEGNEDHAPTTMREAIEASGGSVGTEESTEQQAEVQTQETTEETATEDQTQETTSETQVESSEEETQTEETTEEQTTATDEAEFIDLNSEEEQTQETTEETETQGQPIDFGEILNGEFKNEEDIGGYIEGLHSKIDELEKVTEPEFANDAMKKANEYVQNGGTAADFFKVQGVDVATMNPVDTLVTHLKWNNPNLSDSQARDHILEKYSLEDGDTGSENTQATIDANQAGEEIKKIQADDAPGKGTGLSEEEWNTRQTASQEAENETLLQQDEARMGEWEKPIEDSITNLKEKGIVVDLGNNKGMKYAFNADQKYVDNLVAQAEEALFMSGTSVSESPKLAQQMIEMQYKADHFDKIVKAAVIKGSNTTNKEWFEETNNPSPVARGDKAPKGSQELPSAGEAMASLLANR